MADVSQKTVTTRNLVEGDLGPLRRFTGVLDSMPTEEKEYKDQNNPDKPGRKSTQITVNVKDIEVLEAVEPYHMPIYQMMFTKSNRKKSKWGVFGQSFNEVADQQYTKEQLDPLSPNYVKPSARLDIDGAVGKRIGFVMADGEEGRPKPPMLFDGRLNGGKGGDSPTPTWTVFSIEGLGSIGSKGRTPTEEAINLLDGKTLNQFNTEALANTIIREDISLTQAISAPLSAPNSFVNTMLSSGLFIKDASDVFHKVKK